jgi:hypothetical protein
MECKRCGDNGDLERMIATLNGEHNMIVYSCLIR